MQVKGPVNRRRLRDCREPFPHSIRLTCEGSWRQLRRIDLTRFTPSEFGAGGVASHLQVRCGWNVESIADRVSVDFEHNHPVARTLYVDSGRIETLEPCASRCGRYFDEQCATGRDRIDVVAEVLILPRLRVRHGIDWQIQRIDAGAVAGWIALGAAGGHRVAEDLPGNLA